MPNQPRSSASPLVGLDGRRQLPAGACLDVPGAHSERVDGCGECAVGGPRQRGVGMQQQTSHELGREGAPIISTMAVAGLGFSWLEPTVRSNEQHGTKRRRGESRGQ